MWYEMILMQQVAARESCWILVFRTPVGKPTYRNLLEPLKTSSP